MHPRRSVCRLFLGRSRRNARTGVRFPRLVQSSEEGENSARFSNRTETTEGSGQRVSDTEASREEDGGSSKIKNGKKEKATGAQSRPAISRFNGDDARVRIDAAASKQFHNFPRNLQKHTNAELLQRRHAHTHTHIHSQKGTQVRGSWTVDDGRNDAPVEANRTQQKIGIHAVRYTTDGLWWAARKSATAGCLRSYPKGGLAESSLEHSGIGSRA